jgi:hypothetical protein
MTLTCPYPRSLLVQSLASMDSGLPLLPQLLQRHQGACPGQVDNRIEIQRVTLNDKFSRTLPGRHPLVPLLCFINAKLLTYSRNIWTILDRQAERIYLHSPGEAFTYTTSTLNKRPTNMPTL